MFASRDQLQYILTFQVKRDERERGPPADEETDGTPLILHERSSWYVVPRRRERGNLIRNSYQLSIDSASICIVQDDPEGNYSPLGPVTCFLGVRVNEQSTGTGTKIPRVRLQEEMRTRQEESGCQYHPLLSSRLYYYRRSVAFRAEEGQPPAGRSCHG